MLVDVQAIQRVLRGAYEISNNVCVGFHELRRGVPFGFPGAVARIPRNRRRCGPGGNREYSRGDAVATVIRAAVVVPLLVFGLLMLTSGLAKAQTIPPTSPCEPRITQTPPGWTNGIGTPDCSTTAAWGGTFPWNDAPLPDVPTGDTTFTSMIGGPSYFESILTTMTDLVVGRTYRIPFYAIGRGAVSGGRPNACEGLKLTTSGTEETFLFSDTTAWAQAAFAFTAVSSSQSLEVAADGTTNCLISFALGAEVIEIIKTVSGGDKAGDAVTFTMTVENQGIGPLSGVSISDDVLLRADGTPLTPDSGPTFVSASAGSPEGTLAEGETATYTLAYTLTQEDVDAGAISNQATAEGTDQNGNLFNDISSDTPGVDENPTVLTIPPNPDFDFVKRGDLEDTNGNGQADAGDLIRYTFTIENTGNVMLSDIVVADTMVTVSGSPIASLAPQQSVSNLTGVYEVTQADIDRGFVENLGTATAKDPQQNSLERQSRAQDGTAGNPTVISLEPNPIIEVDLVGEWNDTNGNGYPDPGEPVVYSFVVRNTGNATLKDIAFSSLQIGPDTPQPLPSVAVPSGILSNFPPGGEDSTTFAAISYLLTQADIDAGGVKATATVQGRTLNDAPVSDISDDPNEAADIDVEDDGEPDDPTRTELSQNIALSLQKTGALQGVSGRLAEPGDTILYTFTATNEGNVTISGITPVDPGPQFGGQPGRGTLSAFSPVSVDLASGESEEFTAIYTLARDDINAAQGSDDGVKNTATLSGTGPAGQTVVSPEDQALVGLPGYRISKVTPLEEVRRGGRVPYRIRVSAFGSFVEGVVNIVDMTPPGLTYVRGSAQLDGSSVAPKVDGRKLTFENVTLSGGGEVLIDLELDVTAAAKPGEYVNQAWIADVSGTRVSAVAEAVVEVVVEAVFDCGDILGKVFDDRNRNGYQDAGEPGLAGVRVATVKGLLLMADDQGRFHVACADLPDQRIGTNYIMKLDPRSLPSGYRLTTENPRVVRLTAGKASEFLFGASIGRVVRLDLTDAAFVRGSHSLMSDWQGHVSQLIALLEHEPSVLRLVYAESGEGKRLAKRRINALRKLIASEWRVVGGRYRLEIESRMLSAASRRPGQTHEAVYK